MKNVYVFLCSFLFVLSTWAFAEEAELLDAYLEDLPGTSSTQISNSDTIIGQPVEVVIDENGQSHEVLQPQTVKYRRVETADGSELYEVVPAEQTTHASTEARSDNSINDRVATNNETPARSEHAEVQEDFEVIELEPDESEIVVIEAPDVQITQTGTAANAVSGPVFCQQNPYARECLLSKYLSLCRKDPQSIDCKSELEKFDRFCGIFPNAYKCKKAKIAANCKKNPDTNECRTFTQRYCQKFPKAVFCNYN